MSGSDGGKDTSEVAAAAPPPTFSEALRTWLRIGLLSFGGPTAQIAVMHRIIVDEKKWLDEGRFLNALNFCMLLPGPEAMQLATYAGWWLHGLKGGLAAGLLFVLPGAFVVLALAMIYAAFGNVPVVEALFLGVKAAVLVIVVEALLRISRRALKGREHWIIAALSFVAIFFLGAPFPLIILVAAVVGYLLASRSGGAASAPAQALAAVPIGQTLRTIAAWLAIWIVPLALVALAFGPGHVLSQLGLYFSKLAVVTFGGAYAVLAYMGQAVVEQHGWLSAGEMMDGLGLAETTPGPLILVTEFVGFLAAYRHGGAQSLVPAMIMGTLGAMVTLWATFAPCFLWIFAGAPYLEWLNGQPRLKGALAGITAAVVGVVLNLAVWFALHVLFANKVAAQAWGPLKLWVPTLSALDWRVVGLALLSALMLLRLHLGIGWTLAVASLLALGMWRAGIGL
jgi:chromate transporter